MNELLAIGCIVEPHGHGGIVKVLPNEGCYGKFFNLSDVYLIDGQGNKILHKLWEVRKYIRGQFLMKFNGLKQRASVEKMRKYTIAISNT